MRPVLWVGSALRPILCALSLLLCVATCIMWVRSYKAYEAVIWDYLPERTFAITTSKGAVLFDFDHDIEKTLTPTRGLFYMNTSPEDYSYQSFSYLARNERTIWRIPGLIYIHWDAVTPLVHWQEYYFVFRAWLVVIIFSLLPARALWRFQHRLRYRRLRRAGRCGRCGYDLRATPERCPECGETPGLPAAGPDRRKRLIVQLAAIAVLIGLGVFPFIRRWYVDRAMAAAIQGVRLPAGASLRLVPSRMMASAGYEIGLPAFDAARPCQIDETIQGLPETESFLTLYWKLPDDMNFRATSVISFDLMIGSQFCSGHCKWKEMRSIIAEPPPGIVYLTTDSSLYIHRTPHGETVRLRATYTPNPKDPLNYTIQPVIVSGLRP